ncbi:MAG TPA: 4'-phosphopantetheinyl transferase superfamily protein [Puia sp.]|nr:4'-phosphopantetheinyl transferase superfamily protein [Puia sp.]
MPLFYQHNINANTRLGIWHIQEPESFFLEKVPLKRDVSHPHKRMQHLAGRFLLPVLFNDFPVEEIVIADTRKPFLENEKYHFSISHCGDYAAAIVSSQNRVGVDIEKPAEKIAQIMLKFMGAGDLMESGKSKLPDHSAIDLLTMIWSSKEAIFKWYSFGNVDFRQHMQLNDSIRITGEDEWELPFTFNKSKPVGLLVHAKMLNGLVLAWVVT